MKYEIDKENFEYISFDDENNTLTIRWRSNKGSVSGIVLKAKLESTIIIPDDGGVYHPYNSNYNEAF